MALERFTKDSAEALATALNSVKDVTAAVVAPGPINAFFTVRATLTGKRGATASAEWPFAMTADAAIEHLAAIMDANVDAAKTSKKFLRAERQNNRS